ncbi:caspase family protein [Labrys miyagiensis]|nr:caspase family protein [Labrys miyagiensis]
MRRSLWCFFLLLGLLAAGWAQAAPKAALVIGNGAYRSVTPLVNPPNDAADMAASLGRIGYAVTLVKDGDLQAMNDGLRAFLRDADHADSVVIFYSGHGVQVKGRNYLIPVSAKISDELDLDTQALSLDKLLELVDSAAPKVKIVILDSCRDNPLTRTLVRGAGTRGLARIDLDASSAKGTLIAFSTAPGSVAQDGSGRNSPFTTALLAHMETPGLDIRQMFGQVRADVDQSTQGGQTPWVNEAIIGSFAMAGTVENPQPVKTIAVEPQVQAQPEPQPQPRFQPQPQQDFQQQASNEPPPQPSRPEFILPDSGTRRLNWNDVASLNSQQLRFARNEIYARRGRFMKDEQLRAYFSQFSWYRPWTWDVQLSAVEKANVALIQRAEAGQ